MGGAAQKFGKLSLGDDLSGAIHYAEEGFPVSELIAFYWHFGPEVYKDLPGGFLQTYTLDGKGRTPAKGDIFKNPELARSLRLIGEKGRDAYYKGEIADKIDAFMQANGGYLRKADFEKHTSTWVDPVSVNYRGYDVFELPPNGQGIATLQMLNVLEGFDLRAMGFNSVDALHTMIEAKKSPGPTGLSFTPIPISRRSPRRFDFKGLRGRAPQIDRSESRRQERCSRQSGAEGWRHDLHVHRR